MSDMWIVFMKDEFLWDSIWECFYETRNMYCENKCVSKNTDNHLPLTWSFSHVFWAVASVEWRWFVSCSWLLPAVETERERKRKNTHKPRWNVSHLGMKVLFFQILLLIKHKINNAISIISFMWLYRCSQWKKQQSRSSFD